jgi:hypothetical protein
VKRLGRKNRLPERQRTLLWAIFEKLHEYLDTNRLLTFNALFNQLAGFYIIVILPLLNNALKVFKLMEKFRNPLKDYPMEHKIIYYQLSDAFTTSAAWKIAKENVSGRTLFNMLSEVPIH